jgi:hypothetical protein
LLIEFKKLTFKLGEIEPFYGVIAAYDLEKKKRISENLYFNLNSPEMNKLVTNGESTDGMLYIDLFNISGCSNKGILNISYPSPDIYLVLRIEKILQVTQCF